MRWAALIDGVVIYGIGRAVRAVYAENAETRAIAAKAGEAYATSSYIQRTIPQDIFVPGIISALLMRDTYPANPQPLSAFTMKELFSRGDAERQALAIYNAVLTSPLAFDDDGAPRNDQAIATELGLLWKQERLLRYPQDRAAVETLTVQQELPGALLRALGHRRSLLSTFTREARRERDISMKEVERAIESAKESGNVETKIGKYGTKQNHYRGSNGVTVIIETEGRNAGKIITIWRH